jgi:hypothetical protein
MKTTGKGIVEENELIAKFMGNKFIDDRGVRSWRIGGRGWWENLHYHDNWEWLMPVVEKIEKRTGEMRIEKKLCGLVRELPYEGGKTTIQAVWKMSVIAIKWINANKGKKKK